MVPENKLFHFWKELKRRNVVRVITVYAATAFVILELVSIVADPLKLPEWTLSFIIVFLSAGFIIAVIISWIYDITPEGIEKTKSIKEIEKEKHERPPGLMAWKIATYLSAVVIVVLVILHIVNRKRDFKDLPELEKSIAVLPFENMSDSEEYHWFGDAMTEEIIMQLQKINEFRVLSRTSTLKYKAPEVTIPEIASDLKVNYLIEGSVQRQGDQIRIQVQLIRAEMEDHLWASTYDKVMKDIFQIQSHVAQQIAQELRTVLSPEEVEKIEKEPTENIEAYNLYLKGRYFWNRRTREDVERSITYYKEAIHIDTTFALAYAGLADAYVILGEWRYYPSVEVYPKAKEAAMKAIDLDHDLAEAHNALAAIKQDYEWDWPGAEQEYLKAIELNPSYPTAYQWYAEFLSITGRHDEAIENLLIAEELDPLSPIIYVVGGWTVYHQARHFDQAINQCRKALEIDSNYVGAYIGLAYNYLAMERYEEALTEAKKAVLLSGEIMPEPKAILACVYALTGKRKEAEAILKELIGNLNEIYTCESEIAMIYVALNMREEAIEWLWKAYHNRSVGLIFTNEFPIFDILKMEPGCIELIRKMGFEQ